MDQVARAAAAAFWVCSLLIAYAYLGYPLAIWCCRGSSAGRPSPQTPRRATTICRRLSLLVAAYNEEAVIGERVADAPGDRLPR